MTRQTASAGAVVYALDVERVGAFYRDVAGLPIVGQESDHTVLERDGFQLVVVAIPEHVAKTIRLEDPVVRREDSALKLAFPVTSIQEARVTAVRHGGVVDPSNREWVFGHARVCDGHDPEGNVIQVREGLTRTQALEPATLSTALTMPS